jgi:hypothetical protein
MGRVVALRARRGWRKRLAAGCLAVNRVHLELSICVGVLRIDPICTSNFRRSTLQNACTATHELSPVPHPCRTIKLSIGSWNYPFPAALLRVGSVTMPRSISCQPRVATVAAIFAAAIIFATAAELRHNLYRPLGDRTEDITVGRGIDGANHFQDTLSTDHRGLVDPALRVASESRYTLLAPREVALRNQKAIARSNLCRTSTATSTHDEDRVLSTFIHLATFCSAADAREFGVNFTHCGHDPLPLCE